MTRRIRSLQTLDINWAEEFYTVSEETMAVADSRRNCWICGNAFEIGDGMTVANTSSGNKLMHSRCYRTQTSDEDEENLQSWLERMRRQEKGIGERERKQC